MIFHWGQIQVHVQIPLIAVLIPTVLLQLAYAQINARQQLTTFLTMTASGVGRLHGINDHDTYCVHRVQVLLHHVS